MGLGLSHGGAASPQVTMTMAERALCSLDALLHSSGRPPAQEGGTSQTAQENRPCGFVPVFPLAVQGTRPGSPPASLLFPSASYHGSWAHTSFRVRPMYLPLCDPMDGTPGFLSFTICQGLLKLIHLPWELRVPARRPRAAVCLALVGGAGWGQSSILGTRRPPAISCSPRTWVLTTDRLACRRDPDAPTSQPRPSPTLGDPPPRAGRHPCAGEGCG